MLGKYDDAIGEGDSTSHGGELLVCSGPRVYPGRQLARAGDIVYCPQCMCYTHIEGDGEFARIGQRTSCGATLVSGPPQPVAFAGEDSRGARRLTGGSAAPQPQPRPAPAPYMQPEKIVEPELGSLRIHLVTWSYGHFSSGYPKVRGERTPALDFKLHRDGWERMADYNNKRTMYDLEAGQYAMKLASPAKYLRRQLENVPVPVYSAEDVRDGNGLPEDGAEAGFVVEDRDELDWKSPAQLLAEKNGFKYVRVRYLPSAADPAVYEYEIDGKRSAEFAVDLVVTKGHTEYVIEVDGRYAYIPALEHEPAINYITAYNLSVLALLGYGTTEQTEGRKYLGSTTDVFDQLANFIRPKNFNDKPLQMILRVVPYADRFDPDKAIVFEDDVTGMHALMATNHDSVLLAFSGINRICYEDAAARESEEIWQAFKNSFPLPFLGREASPDSIRMTLRADSRNMDIGPDFRGVKGLPGDKPLGPFGGKADDWVRDGATGAGKKADARSLKNKPQVHGGAYDAFHGLQEAVYEFLENEKAASKKLYIAGSCMGAAVASLIIADMKPEEGKNQLFYSFGMPRMIDKKLAMELDSKAAHFRISVMGDILQSVPYTHEWLDEDQALSGMVSVLNPFGGHGARAVGMFRALTAHNKKDYRHWGECYRLMYHDADIPVRENSRYVTHGWRLNGPLLPTPLPQVNGFDSICQVPFTECDNYPEMFEKYFDTAAPGHNPHRHCEVLGIELEICFQAMEADSGDYFTEWESYHKFLWHMERYITNECETLAKQMQYIPQGHMNRLELEPMLEDYARFAREISQYRQGFVGKYIDKLPVEETGKVDESEFPAALYQSDWDKAQNRQELLRYAGRFTKTERA